MSQEAQGRLRLVELLVEALAVGVRPESANPLPKPLLAVLGHREDVMRRTGVGGFGSHALVLSIVSPPDGGLDARSQAEAEKRGFHKLSERHRRRGAARNPVEEASGFDGPARLGRTGHKERTFGWRDTGGDALRRRTPHSRPHLRLLQKPVWLQPSGYCGSSAIVSMRQRKIVNNAACQNRDSEF